MKTCFISAPRALLTSRVEAVVSRMGFRVVTPSDSPVGQTIAESLLLLIQQSQLVIAIWDSSAPGASNVAFELGVAFGANIPTLLVVENPQNLPSDFSSFPLVISALDNEEALGFAITQVASHSQKQKKIKSHDLSGTRDEISETVTEVLAEVGKGNIRESEVARLLTKALEARGATVISEAKLTDQNKRSLHPDYLVFDPELESLLGGPLLIELKNSMHRDAEQAGRQQLKRYLATGVTRWALLLVYPHARNVGYFAELEQGQEQNILVLGTIQFLELLANKTLPSVIRQMRNQYVHRGPA